MQSNSSASSSEPISLIASTVPFFFDTNLLNSELELFRSLHSHHRNGRTSSCVDTVLQGIWDSYGNLPTDASLLYASLMWHSYWKDYETPGWSPTGTNDFFTYKGKFHSALSSAMRSGNMNECHFLAVFLASQSTKSGVRVAGFKEELHTYQQGIVRIHQVLLSQVGEEHYRPLRNLYNFILSFSRRIMCRGDFSMPEYLIEDAAKGIPTSEDEIQLTRTSVEPPLRSHHDEEFQHDWDRWHGTVCCLCKEFATMAACFEIFLVSSDTCKLNADAIRATRQKLDNLCSINDISYIFRTVRHPVPFLFDPFPCCISGCNSVDEILTLR